MKRYNCIVVFDKDNDEEKRRANIAALGKSPAITIGLIQQIKELKRKLRTDLILTHPESYFQNKIIISLVSKRHYVI